MVLQADDTALYEKFGIRWYDDAHTILLCEPPSNWTWDDAYTILKLMNGLCDTVEHGVYSVFYYRMTHASVLPKGNAVPHIRRLLNITHPNDELVIFVGANTFARRMIDMAGRLYGFRALVSDFRFVDTLDAMKATVRQHKAQSNEREAS